MRIPSPQELFWTTMTSQIESFYASNSLHNTRMTWKWCYIILWRLLLTPSQNFHVTDSIHTSANWGPNLTFVDKASSTRSSPKPSKRQVIKLIDWSWVTQLRGESRITSTLIITHFWVVRQVITCILYHLLTNSDCRSSHLPKFASI